MSTLRHAPLLPPIFLSVAILLYSSQKLSGGRREIPDNPGKGSALLVDLRWLLFLHQVIGDRRGLAYPVDNGELNPGHPMLTPPSFRHIKMCNKIDVILDGIVVGQFLEQSPVGPRAPRF